MKSGCLHSSQPVPRPHRTAALLLACLGTTLQGSADGADSVEQEVDSGTFRITIPAGNGWQVSSGGDRVLLTREDSSGGHRVGTTAILVLRTRPRDADCGLPADQTASNYCDQEEFELWVNGQMTGLFGVSGLERETVTVGDKQLYAMSYRLEFSEHQGGARTDNRMYVYFPPSFGLDDHFFVFMLTEACLPHHCEAGSSAMDETELRAVIDSLQIPATDDSTDLP